MALAEAISEIRRRPCFEGYGSLVTVTAVGLFVMDEIYCLYGRPLSSIFASSCESTFFPQTSKLGMDLAPAHL